MHMTHMETQAALSFVANAECDADRQRKIKRRRRIVEVSQNILMVSLQSKMTGAYDGCLFTKLTYLFGPLLNYSIHFFLI